MADFIYQISMRIISTVVDYHTASGLDTESNRSISINTEDQLKKPSMYRVLKTVRIISKKESSTESESHSQSAWLVKCSPVSNWSSRSISINNTGQLGEPKLTERWCKENVNRYPSKSELIFSNEHIKFLITEVFRSILKRIFECNKNEVNKQTNKKKAIDWSFTVALSTSPYLRTSTSSSTSECVRVIR